MNTDEDMLSIARTVLLIVTVFFMGFFMMTSRAHAQVSGGVTSSGTITPGDCAEWLAINVLEDSGSGCGGGGGSGVSSFSGDGSFATNATSTGAVTLTLGNAAAYSVWGNATGSSAAPGYTNSPEVLNLTTSGTLTVNGNASLAGTTTLATAQIAAGNATLTNLTATTITGTTGNFPTLNFTTGTGTNLALSGTTTVGANTFGPNGGNLDKVTVGCGNAVAAGSAVPTGSGPPTLVVTGGTIVSATIIGSLSGSTCSAVVDVWKRNAALPSVSNTITASDLPTLSSGTYAQDTTLTGWTKSVSANDVFMCNINSSTCDKVSVTIGINK